jgi:hypothetical protein
MKKVGGFIFILILISAIYSVYASVNSVNTKNNSNNLDCQNFFYIDNENKNCEQKEFCGMYMYQGLQTFEDRIECQNAVGAISPQKMCAGGTTNENGSCMYQFSNGRKTEVKIMPDVASERAIEKLGELNFTLELKEVGSGNEKKVVYELEGEKQGKFLGIFKIMAKVRTQIDADTGEITKVKKPWWSFLASGI